MQIVIVGHKTDEVRREVPRLEAEAFAARENVAYA